MNREEFFRNNKELLNSPPEYCEKCGGEIRLICKDVANPLPGKEGSVYEDVVCDCEE